MELNKKYLDQQGLSELIQTIAQISYNLSDTDELLSTHIENVTDLLFGENYDGTFPDETADTKAKPLVGSVEKILDYLGLSEDSEEGESVKKQLEDIWNAFGKDEEGNPFFNSKNTVSDNIARIDSIIGEGFEEKSVSEQLAAEVDRATTAEGELKDELEGALGTFEDGSTFNELVSTSASGTETHTETVAEHIEKIEKFVGLSDESEESLLDQIKGIKDELGFAESDFVDGVNTIKKYIDSKDEAIENELGFAGELGGEVDTVKQYIDKNRAEVEKELGFSEYVFGGANPENIKDYIDKEVSDAKDYNTDYVDNVLGKDVDGNPFFDEDNTVKKTIEDHNKYAEETYFAKARVGALNDGHITITLEANRAKEGEDLKQIELDLNLEPLTRDSFLKGSYKLQIETYGDYKEIAGDKVDPEVTGISDRLLVAFDPDTFVIYSVQDNSLNDVEGKLAWPQKGSYNPTDVFLVFEFTTAEGDVASENKETIWLNVSDLVKSYDFDAKFEKEYPEGASTDYSGYNIEDYFDFGYNVSTEGEHKTEQKVVYTFTVKDEFVKKMRKIDKTVAELRNVEEWLGYNGEEGDNILNRLDEVEKEVEGLAGLKFEEYYEPKVEDEAAVAVKKYVDDAIEAAVAEEAGEREKLEDIVGSDSDFDKDNTVIDHIKNNEDAIDELVKFTGYSENPVLPHEKETLPEVIKEMDDEFHTFVNGEYANFKKLVGEIDEEHLQHFGKIKADGEEHNAQEGANTLVAVVEWNTEEIHELGGKLAGSNSNIADLQEKVNDLQGDIDDIQDQIGAGFDKNNSISDKIDAVNNAIEKLEGDIEDAINEEILSIPTTSEGAWRGPSYMSEISVKGAFDYWFGEMSKGDLSIEDLLKA